MDDISAKRIPLSFYDRFILHYTAKNLVDRSVKDGFCFGFSLKVIEAWLSKTTDLFNENLQRIINEAKALTLDTVLETIKEKNKKHEILTEKEKLFSETQAFFETLVVSQSPVYFYNLFGKAVTQHDISDISAITSPKSIQDLGGLLTTYSEPHILTEKNHVEQLEAFKTILDENTGLLLQAENHCIAITYNPKTKYWGLSDANGWLLFETQDASKLFQKIYMCFKYFNIGFPYYLVSHIYKLLISDNCPEVINRLIHKHFHTDALTMNVCVVNTQDHQYKNTELKYKLSQLRQAWSLPGALQKEIESPTSSASNIYEELLLLAAKLNKPEIIRELHRNGVNMQYASSDGNTIAHYAAQYGHLEILDMLTELGIDATIQKTDHSPVHSAATSSQLAAITKLKELGADLNFQGKTGISPVLCAVYLGNVQAINKLAELGANINIQDNNGRTPVHMAVQKGDIETISKLAELGANLNIQDNNGYAPAFYAAEFGLVKIIGKLAELGANINIQDNNGYAPIHIAAQEGQNETITKLKELGANLNMQSNDGHTPTHVAAALNKTDAITTLANLGANLNMQDNNGHTPAYYAAQYGLVEALEALIEHGVDLHSEENGNALAMIALMNGHSKVLNMLRKNGFDITDSIELDFLMPTFPLFQYLQESIAAKALTLASVFYIATQALIPETTTTPLDLNCSF